jgi:single-strand DNA-binding protein
MPNLNKVFLMGNLTKDLELKYGKNGQPVTNIRLAINRVYTTQTGEKKEDVCFLTAVVWGKQAETCHTYLKKGSAVFIEGRLHLNTWDDAASGQKKSMLEVVADRVQFLDRKKKEEGEGEGSAPPAGEGGSEPESPQSGGDSVPF